MAKKKTKWICSVCKSDEIEEKCWRPMNEPEVIIIDDCADYWCPGCEDTVGELEQVEVKP